MDFIEDVLEYIEFSCQDKSPFDDDQLKLLENIDHPDKFNQLVISLFDADYDYTYIIRSMISIKFVKYLATFDFLVANNKSKKYASHIRQAIAENYYNGDKIYDKFAKILLTYNQAHLDKLDLLTMSINTGTCFDIAKNFVEHDKYYDYLIKLALQRERLDIAKLLLKYDDGPRNYTALIEYAAGDDHEPNFELVKIFVSRNSGSKNYKWAIQVATEKDATDIANYLTEAMK